MGAIYYKVRHNAKVMMADYMGAICDAQTTANFNSHNTLTLENRATAGVTSAY